MSKVLSGYEAHVERLRMDGVEFAEYPCPYCGEMIASPLRGPGAIVDSLATCPHCEEQYLRVVNCDGRIEAEEF